MSLTDKEKFDQIIGEFSVFKLDYNIKELQRIKERAHQILAISVLLVSIVFATLTPQFLDKLWANGIMLIIGVMGFVVLVINIALCYGIMIVKLKNKIIDPKPLYDHYENEELQLTKDTIRVTMFDILKEMDKRNEEYHDKMWTIYILTPISLSAIFIPVIFGIIVR